MGRNRGPPDTAPTCRVRSTRNGGDTQVTSGQWRLPTWQDVTPRGGERATHQRPGEADGDMGATCVQGWGAQVKGRPGRAARKTESVLDAQAGPDQSPRDGGAGALPEARREGLGGPGQSCGGKHTFCRGETGPELWSQRPHRIQDQTRSWLLPRDGVMGREREMGTMSQWTPHSGGPMGAGQGVQLGGSGRAIGGLT